jgi:hypothetical protein
MSTLEEILAPQIDLTIDGLNRKRFTPDPISGKHYSKITSVISSACKRHGFILERAIRALSANLSAPKWWVGDYPISVAHRMRSKKIHDLAIPIGEDVRSI